MDMAGSSLSGVGSAIADKQERADKDEGNAPQRREAGD
jgi:hypothetical protein